MNIYLASDHAGFNLKERIKRFLIPDHDVTDFGAHVYDPEDDYPEFIQLAAVAVQNDPEGRGIIFGGSGQGEAIAANRFTGVRAVVYYGGGIQVEHAAATSVHDIIALSREHNDANVLSIGARFVDEDKIFLAVNQWLNMPFSSQERHVRRIKKIEG